MHQGHDGAAWCYVSGWVNVLETQLLGAEIYNALLEARELETAWGVLSKTGYRSYFESPEDLRHFERRIGQFSSEQRSAVRALCPEPNLVAFFDLDGRYRSERARWTDMGEEDLEAAVPPFTLDGFLQTFPEILRPVSVEDYGVLLASALERRRSVRSLSPKALSAVLDSLYLSLLLTWGRQWSGTLIQEYVERYVQLKLVEVVLRSLRRGMDMELLDRYLFLGPLRMGPVATLLDAEEYPDVRELMEVLLPTGFSVSGGMEVALEAFQRAAERFLLESLWPARYVVFGAEKVFGYLCGLQNQEVNMRLCLSTVLYSLDPRLVGERLRPTYV